MSAPVRGARKAAHGTTAEVFARFGLGCRAFLYTLLGLLTVAVALGRSQREDDQQGALTLLAQSVLGKVLLVLIGLGFVGYAVWRLSEAVFGTAGERGKTGPRLQSLVRGIVYGGIAISTFRVLSQSGHGTSQSARQQSLSAGLLHRTGGRFLLCTVGVVVVIVGIVMIFDGVRRKFLRYLNTQNMSGDQQWFVERAGAIGTCARGGVVALTGALVIDAAFTGDSRKAGGLDLALHTLAQQPYGKALLLVAALGLVVFGLYGFAEARWHKTL